MSPIKELYKGKCLEDLSKHYTIPNLKNLKLKVLCNSAQKVYMEAEKSLREGDEEQSFIYFMKYFNVIDTIKKTPDYAREKQYISDLLGTNTKQMLAMDKAEKLSNSLKKRYSLLARQERALEKLNELEEYNRLRDKIDADIEMGKSKGNLSHQVSLTQKTSFTSQELFAMLKDAKIGVFIMDCRPRGDFVVSRLTCNNYINVPEEIILPGMSAGKIQQELDQNDRKLWASRGLQDHIVLMDWNSKGPEPTRNTPLWRLKDILENWDQDATYKSLLMLEGGYEDYILLYPMQCTNPGVKPPNSGSDDYDILDDIEYPSINDIVMKDDTLSQANLSGNRIQQVPGRPGIDRNSKAVALKTYEQKKQIQEILDEQEKLAEKSLINEKERLAAETNWEELRLQREMAAVEELRQNLLAREQEVMYNMLQLENKHRDYVQENDQLREELEEYKRREKELTRQGEIISEREAKLLEEAAAQRIREKEEEMRHIDEQREKLTQEREKKLAFAREQKSHLKPIENESMPQAKLPQFDRTVKPVKLDSNSNQNIQRDFSPAYGSPGRGLTGLKNLGNTCYMNSIMQCISNTNCLVEYLIEGTYQKHINRSNKTQGRIVEEVAAVVRALWSGQYKFIASKDLRYIIGQYQKIFRGIEQQDSHEFLTILMDWLHSDLQTLHTSESPRDNLPMSEKAWLEYTKSKESLILRLFYGQIKSTVKCKECNKESATYECFSNLSLELPPTNNRCLIQNCLDMYFNGESIRGWNCPNCKQKRDAVKKLDISRLPPILVIHFKRFYADPDSIVNTYKKKQNYIKFPLSDLDMAPYIARSEIRNGVRFNTLYNLYAVSNHYGSMESGHYTAFCKSSVFGKWYKFDDHVVSSLDPTDVGSSAGYILFYTNLPQTPPPEVRG